MIPALGNREGELKILREILKNIVFRLFTDKTKTVSSQYSSQQTLLRNISLLEI
jgi:hypothetical protein